MSKFKVSRDSATGQLQGIKSCRIEISSTANLKTFFKGKRFAKCALMFLCKVAYLNFTRCSFTRLDQAVYKYFLNVRSRNIPVNDPMLKQKAMSYAR